MTLVYWSTTGVMVLYLLLSSWSYMYSPSTIEGIRALGFPDYFRVQLAVLKLVASLVLIVPSIPQPLKEWAYAGVALFLLTALVAHQAHQDPVWFNLINALLFVLLALSRWACKFPN